MADPDPIKDYWKRLPPVEAERQGREILRRSGHGRSHAWRSVLLVLLVVAFGALATIYLWAWISALR